MDFEIQTKDKKGNIVFQGTANKEEASFLLSAGINWLLLQGLQPMLKGPTTEEIAEEPEQMQ